MRLFYYMGPEFLRQNLQKRRLKISRYGRHGKLNDPFELAPYDISDPALREVHRKQIDQLAGKMGLICLSETWKSPAMWAHYTKNHEGACLEFEITYDHVIKVKYQKEKLFPDMNLQTFSECVNVKNVKEVMGTKSSDWSYEEEHRLHVPLNDETVIQENGMHFMPFQIKRDNTFMLKRVLVGFRCGCGISNLVDDVKDYRQKVEVIQTRPAFRKFEVEKQKNKMFWNMNALREREEVQNLPAYKAVYGGTPPTD